MENKQKQEGFSEILGLLEEYADIRDELEDALLSFQTLHAEIEYAMEDITEELETLNQHLQACSNRLIRFKNPVNRHYEVIKEQCEHPFANVT